MGMPWWVYLSVFALIGSSEAAEFPGWDAYHNHPLTNPAKGVKLVGPGNCQPREQAWYQCTYIIVPNPHGPAEHTRHCAQAAIQAAKEEPGVVGFTISPGGECAIRTQPGFTDKTAAWVRRAYGTQFPGRPIQEWVKGQAHGPITRAPPFRKYICYSVSVEEPKSPSHHKKIKEEKQKLCEGSGNGQDGTGQVGSVCCFAPNGGMCCIGAVAGKNGGTEVKGVCAKPSSLWLRLRGSVMQSNTANFTLVLVTIAAALVGITLITARRLRNMAAATNDDVAE